MNYRKATMLARESASTAATKTIDVDLSDVISRIQIRFEPINNGNVQTAHPAKCVSKIELVDGSDVLMSLSGMEAQALDFYDTKQGREYEMDMRNDMPDQEFFNLNFGRKLWDPLLAFDPKKFKNPQLKITHNRALGGSAPDDAYLSVYADVFDEKVVTPVGWLMAKEFFNYTVTASAYKYIDLPKDHILRKIMVQALVANTTFTDQIDELKISEDNDKKVPIDLGLYQFIVGIMKKYPLYQEIIAQTLPTVGDNTTYVTPGEYVNVNPGVIGTATVYKNATNGGGVCTLNASAAAECRSLVTGYMPHGCLPVEFGDPDVPEDWYDITKIGDLKLRLHAPGGATASVNVILQQLRKYA
jgi:hypothetical protein